jgi:hypothetical protein
MSFLTVLPLAFVMIAGPQIISATLLATGPDARRNSLAFLAGAALAITAGTMVAYWATSLLEQTADPGFSFRLGLLLFLVMPTDIITMFTVGAAGKTRATARARLRGHFGTDRGAVIGDLAMRHSQLRRRRPEDRHRRGRAHRHRPLGRPARPAAPQDTWLSRLTGRGCQRGNRVSSASGPGSL